jgi:hypothetical protein
MALKIIECSTLSEQLNIYKRINKSKLLQGNSKQLPSIYRLRTGLKEADILKATKQLLNVLDIWHRRIDNAGKIVHTHGASVMVQGEMRGLPDILGCHEGRMLAIECKAPGGTVSSDQYAVLSDLTRLGARVAIVVNVGKLQAWIERGEITAWCDDVAVI